MSEKRHFISIWFFIGSLLLVYGFLILGAGIYELFYPTKSQVTMSYLHAEIWWGLLLLAIGGIYVSRFRPGKRL
jgi:hypothetical protein